MLTGISYEGLKMLSNFAVKVGKLKLRALYFLLVELRNETAHVFEVCRRLVNHMLYKIMTIRLKVFRRRQAERSPHVGFSGVIPESYIRQINLMHQMGIVGVLTWREKFERDFREAAQSNGEKLCGLSGIIPWSSSKAGKTLSDLGVNSLQGFDLGLHASKGRFNAPLGGFALSVEIHGLPDSHASQDDGYDASDKTNNFHDSPGRT